MKSLNYFYFGMTALILLALFGVISYSSELFGENAVQGKNASLTISFSGSDKVTESFSASVEEEKLFSAHPFVISFSSNSNNTGYLKCSVSCAREN